MLSYQLVFYEFEKRIQHLEPMPATDIGIDISVELELCFQKKFAYFFLSLLQKQGLMRQLVLVPGTDATHHICPSTKPQLAALSVPLILLDLPVTAREGDSHLSTHSNLQMYFFRTRSQHSTTTLSVLPFCYFHSSLFLPSVTRSQTVKKRETSRSRAAAVVFREAAR